MQGLPVRPEALASEDVVLLVTRAERLLSRRLREVLDAHGRSLDEWRVLSILADGAGHPMTEVSELAFLPPGSLTKLVDHLADENLVYRRIDAMDRRRIRAYITPRGRTTHERLTRAVRAVWGELAIGYEDSGRLTDLLRLLVGALQHR
ncbi:MarR family winged helix-turn-helix transcriptional regulator [Phytohabitans flavus]|uniref:MarR family transcriptional regulator n=1 Tax=Phytohabitans flavus TaxID=1076124 RepID=A0A6F8XK82_9ACTN|nr:MarR family transcriptional regulator [Phytohabitans flavus]BCB74226.1 MarR family transcriptional regulator [Phytohabitans flavus]